MSDDKKFIITTKDGIAEIQKQLKKLFLDGGRKFDKESISHLFRIGSTLKYKEKDYNGGTRGSNYSTPSDA